MESLTAERVRHLFTYFPETGEFVRRVPTGYRNCNRVGELAGQTTAAGYRAINVDGARYFAHRLAWLYTTGAWPTQQIDHINGVRDDNRWANLRDVSQAENLCNQRLARSNNRSSQFLGVSFDRRRGKWKACIFVAGKQKQLGRFDTEQEARDVYRTAKPQLHGVEPTWPN